MPIKKQSVKQKTKNNLNAIFGSAAPQHRFFPSGLIHNFHIYGEIDEAQDYVDFITVLDTATDNDLVNIYLNTPGGNLMTAISIIHAMNRSQTNIVAYADGEVASAGSLIFFAAPNKAVMPYSQLMLHDASMFTGGKLSESIKGITAMTELVSRMAHDIYYPYFNESEIKDILDGKDFYCNAEEIYARLERGEEIIKELSIAEEESSKNEKKSKKK